MSWFKQNKMINKWQEWTPYFHSILRIISAIMFILAGTSKLFAFPAGMPPKGSTANLLSQIGIGGILEVFGGAMILVGLCTRPVAFVLAGEMAVAYFQFHAQRGFYPTVNGGVAAVMYCFVWLYFSSAGAGKWSFDNLRKK